MRYEVDENGCWSWTGYISPAGYGVINKTMAHRLVYELLVGRILAGFEIHHTCRNRRCINPEHLEAQLVVEHRLLHHPKHAKCKWGHDFDATNTYITKKGERQCRKCKARRERERHARARQLAQTQSTPT